MKYISLSALLILSCSMPCYSVDSKVNEQAKKLVQEGKLQEALTLEQQVAKSEPNSSTPHLAMTAIYQAMGMSDKALEEAQLAVKLSPSSGNAHYNLATVYYSRRQLANALEEYQKAVSLGKGDVHAQRAIAQCLLESGRIPEALSRLEALSKKYPTDKDIWLNLGRAYLLYGDPTAAGLAAEKAVNLAPDFYPALILKADVKLSSAQFSDARELALKALSLNPHYPVAYLVLGQLASYNIDKPDEALNLVTEARKFVKNSPQVFFLLGSGFARVAATKTVSQDPRLSRKWFDVTELALKTAADQAPQELEPNLLVAKIMLDRRRPVEALPYAERAYAIAPQNKQVQQIYKAASVAKYDLVGNFMHWYQSTFQKK